MKQSLGILTALALLCAALLGGCGSPASVAGGEGATDWPTREIRLIVPYKEGGASHKSALMIKSAANSYDLTSQPFIVVCMPDAATLEGQEEVLYADPDGYTLLVHHNAMINNYALGKQDFTYTDFRMICQLYETPLAIAVRSDSPFQTLDDLVAAIQADPGAYSWTWAGIGGNTHFASYIFYQAAGLGGEDVIPSITKGDSDSVISVLGGTSDICMAQTNAYTEYVKSGEIRVLGHSGQGAMDIGGVDVPSWSDQGYDAGYLLRCFVFAPLDTPEPVVEEIGRVIRAAVESDEFRQAMLEDGFEPTYLNEADSLAAFSALAEEMNEVAKSINLED